MARRLLLPRLLGKHKNFSTCANNFQKEVGPDRLLPATDLRAWQAEAPVRLRDNANDLATIPPLSVPSMLKNQVDRLPDGRALQKRGNSGEELVWTWAEYHTQILSVARAFIELGLEPFHTVAILGHNDPCWHMSNLAAVHAGGFATGIYQTNSASACQYIAEDSRANILVVGDLEQLAKVLSIRSSLPHLRVIVLYGDEEVPAEVEGVISWQNLLEIGNNASEGNLRARLANIAINQCCALSYTSGTTGNPKGTMLSHDSMTYAARQNMSLFKLEYAQETSVSYLPQSHILGMMMDIYNMIPAGGVCYFADKNALKGTLLENIQHYRPTRTVGVPRVWEKIEEGIKSKASSRGPKKMVMDWAKRQALAHHAAEEKGVPHSSLGYTLAHMLIFSKLHKALGMEGGKGKGYAIGGAAVSPETVRYFLSLDMKLLEMTGMTETVGMVPITNLDEPGGFRIGKVGKVYPHYFEVKVKDRDSTGAGEMLCRGRGTCMGYLNNKEKTMEALDDDGWLHSGDLVREDNEGFFTMVGRIKEIIIPAGGENVAPVNIEEEIKSELQEVVSNVMVVGDGRKYLTCLITLKVTADPETLAPTKQLDSRAIGWLQSLGSEVIISKDGLSTEELQSSSFWPLVEAAIQAGIDRANQRAISNVATIKKWTLLTREFSVDGGELGPSLKLKRFHVAEKYRETINEMYQ